MAQLLRVATRCQPRAAASPTYKRPRLAWNGGSERSSRERGEEELESDGGGCANAPHNTYHFGWPSRNLAAVREVLGSLDATLPLMPGVHRAGEADTARLLSLLLGAHGPATAVTARGSSLDAKMTARAAKFQSLLVAGRGCEACTAAGRFREEKCVAARSVHDFYNAVPGCRATRQQTLAWPDNGLALTFPQLLSKELTGHDGYIYIRACGRPVDGAAGEQMRREALLELQRRLRAAVGLTSAAAGV